MARSRPWDRRDGESATWFARFADHYLPLGPERSIDEAYRHYLGEDRAGRNPDHRRPPRRAPGSWKEAAAKHDWARRADAWDEAERERAREASLKRRLARQERHEQAVAALADKSLRAALQAKLDDLPADRVVRLAMAAIDQERAVLGLTAPEPPPGTTTVNVNASPDVHVVNVHGHDLDAEVVAEFIKRKAQRDAALAAKQEEAAIDA